MPELSSEEMEIVLIHQARCSKLDEGKRAYRRAILQLMIVPEKREEFMLLLDDLGLSDCYGKDADSCLSN